MNEMIDVVDDDNKGKEEDFIKTSEIIVDVNEYEEVKKKVSALSSVRELVYLFVKRCFDIVCGLIGVVCLVPLIVIVKIVNICNKDFDSIFYFQKRIGKDGKEFKLYKFRSMVVNADEILEQTLKNDKKRAEEWKKYQKFENDPRITKIGNILRKTSLDEAPQFINILKGDMSMIGPRPLVPGELDSHNGNHEIYESVRPGITGWWACNGRSATTYEERLDLEYYYVKNRSLWLDIKCVFKTISAVICKKGAK